MFSFPTTTITKPTWLPTNKVFLATFSLHFFNSAIQVICMSYSNALFLSTYPIKWLPWLFIIQSLFDISASAAIEPYVSKNEIKTNIMIYLFFAVIIIAFIFLLHLNYWIPFVYTLLINTIGLLIGIIVWSTARSAMDIIEFKQISFWLSTAGAISSIIFGIFIAEMLKQTQLIMLLPWLIGVFILVSSVFFIYLKPLPMVSRVATRGSKPIKYPLYRKLFFTVFLITISSTFIDYCFRSKLAANYDTNGIAIFMAYYVSISSVGALIVSLILIKYVINNFGVTFLFYVLPIYTLIFSLQSFFLPNMLLIAMLAAGKPIFYYGLFSVGREMILNVLPMQARLKGQFILKTFCGPLACILASGVIFLLGRHASIYVSILAVIAVNILIILYLRTIRAEYSKTLDEEINLKRFIADDDYSQVNTKGYGKTISKAVKHLLRDKETENVLFGLILLQKMHPPKSPKEVFEIINKTKDEYVKIVAIDTISRFATDETTLHLFQTLNKEKNPEVIWQLFKSLSQINPQLALPKAHVLLENPDPHIKAGAICTLLKGGNFAEVQQAVKELKIMFNSREAKVRQIVPEILSNVPSIGNVELEFTTLIDDPNPAVSRAAIRALKIIKLPHALPNIINHVLRTEGLLQESRSTIQAYGKEAIPLLEKSIEENLKHHNVKSLIIILASLPYYEVETFLIKLAHSERTQLRTIIANAMAKRTYTMRLNSELYGDVKNILIEEMTLIKHLNYLHQHYQQTEIKNEITSRINIAKIRILCWLAVYKDKPTIINIVPTILQGMRYEKTKALEFIDSLFVNKLFAAQIIKIFMDEVELNHTDLNRNLYLDDWLKYVISVVESNKDKPMDTIEKMFVLRKVPIFKMLDGELLLSIAEETSALDMQAGQSIFKKGDPPDGIYIVVSGKVKLTKDSDTISYVTENGFFGELALLDNETRYADAVAETEGMLLFLDKQTFNQISDDQPIVFRETVNYVMQYLRGYLKE